MTPRIKRRPNTGEWNCKLESYSKPQKDRGTGILVNDKMTLQIILKTTTTSTTTSIPKNNTTTTSKESTTESSNNAVTFTNNVIVTVLMFIRVVLFTKIFFD